MQAKHAGLVEQHGNQAELHEAVTSLMEMQGKSAAPSFGNTASLASSSASASTDGNQGDTLKAWRFKDQRVTRAGRQQDRSTRKDPRVGKPRAQPDQINRDQSDRSNKKRLNDSASAPAQDAPAQVAEEVPPTRALNLRRFAEVQELPLQADLTVTNEQEQVSVVSSNRLCSHTEG